MLCFNLAADRTTFCDNEDIFFNEQYSTNDTSIIQDSKMMEKSGVTE
jgi:hypothetical protein